MPGTKPERSRLGTVVTVVAAFMALACLGAGTGAFFLFRKLSDPAVSAAPADKPTGSPTDEPAGEPTPGAGASVLHNGDIARFVLSPPSDAHAWPNVKAAQTLDLTSAAADFGEPAQGATVLKSFGFRDGFARRWIDPVGNRMTIQVFRFTKPNSGQDFASVDIQAFGSGDWGDPQAIPDVPDEASFVKPTLETNGYQQAVAVGAYSDIAVVAVAEQRPPARTSVPDELLADEIDLL